MRKIILLMLFLTLSLCCFAQNNNVTYAKYTLIGTGYISIPSTMELQSGNYKKTSESFQRMMGSEIAGDRVVFQLKGFNDGLYPSAPSYEKVIFTTIRGMAYAEYEKILTTKDAVARQKLLKELDRAVQREYKNSPIPVKMLFYNEASIVVVNGQPAVKVSYLRQVSDNEPCYTDIYTFQNTDRGHRLTISYRKSKASIWKPILEKVLNSFTITNK
jgi:hypothetical protein